MRRDDWDARYTTAEYVWDVEPNRFVAEHVADLQPGVAVDLGAGEGRNTVWLARRGWRVHAVDFSEAGLAKAQRLAEAAGVADRVELIAADATTWQAATPIDLALVAYLQLPSEQVRDALTHAASWLRPGGTILVVAHDRSNIERGWGGPQAPEVCYDLDATLEALVALDVERAEVAAREVSTDEGTRTALDTLVIAHRPLTG